MRLLFRLVTSLITIVLMLGALLLWRLGQGPIPLDFLTPRIEAAARDVSPDLSVKIGSTQLAWDQEESQIDLLAGDVVISGAAEQSFAVPKVSVRFRIAPLLQGDIELASVDLVEPTLQLVRETDGFHFGIGSSEVTKPKTDADPRALLARLGRLGIRDGTVVIDDRVTKQTWKMSAFDIEIAPVDLASPSAATSSSAARVGPAQPAGSPPPSAAISLKARTDIDLSSLLDSAAASSAPAQAEAQLTYQPDTDTLTLAHAQLTLDGVSASAKGSITGATSGDLKLDLDVNLAAMATIALARQWPPSLAADARQWVTRNITGGNVSNAVLRLVASRAAGADLQLETLDGKLTFADLNVRFLDTMPPVTGVSGTATATLAGGVFNVTKGRLLDIEVSQASVRLPAGKKPSIAIDAGVRGPLASVFAVLDKKPVELAALLGFAPHAGAMTGRVGLAFALRDGLRYDDLGLTARADVRDAAVERIVNHLSLSGGNFTVALKGPSVSLDGRARLQDVPLEGSLRQTIGRPESLRLEGRGDVDAAGWKRLGLDPQPWVAGTTAVQVVLVPAGRGAIQLDAKADLRRAVVDLPGDALHKPAGEPGRVAARLRFDGGALTRIDGFHLDYGANAFSGNATRSTAGQWRTLDGKLILAPPKPDRPAGQATVEIAAGGGFMVQSGDAGALLGSIGMPAGQRGRLNFNGKADLNAPGVPVDGKLLIRGLVVNESPLLTQLLTLASLRGMLNVMTRDGIVFDRVVALLSQRAGVLTVREGAAHGSTLSLRASGTIDAPTDRLDLKGSVIPSYFGLNEAVAKVPLLGQLLAGTEGKGVQSFDFTATGVVNAPKVSLSAFSSLTPNGFSELLRRLE